MRKTFTTLAATALTASGLIGVATPAQAAEAPLNGTWWQSVGRASVDAPCPDINYGLPSWQRPFKGQREWTPSWAQWPNEGTGGYVCNRVIVWAEMPTASPSPSPSPGYPSAGCVGYDDGYDSNYVNFGGGWNIGVAPRYTDAACTALLVWGFPPTTDPIELDYVYAPAGYNAVALCEEAFAGVDPAAVNPAGTEGVHYCFASPV